MESGGNSISKVTVEYHDPSGVFPLISRQLQGRLPLRDLHWKSPTRPLRSIDFLHVDLVPSKDVTSTTPQSRQGTPVPGQEDGSAPPTLGSRRHQIPGLRQTPYLKVYLLRCDDNDIYKNSSRKALREWLKTYAATPHSSSSKSGQENHDAFEWLILHVVLPNTAAAQQPRSSGSSSKSEGASTEKSGSSSRLLSRGSSTILEKVKADFNVSSKSAPDRVAQIRLQSEDVPQNSLPQKPAGSSPEYEESPQDRANAWNDVVLKLRTLILSSFNLRVSQYEEDIRERNAQRALPGWNFCTFFVLKEGLARGFESVGLVDDALIGYDELSLGLDNAIQDQQSDGSSSRSDSFLQCTEEFKQILARSVNAGPKDVNIVWQPGEKVISPFRKAYRDMILTSSISVFDFQCYIFARQMTILLRMGILHSSELASLRQDRTSTNTPPHQIPETEMDDLAPLSELCQRTSAFITSISRIMREDLRHLAEVQKINAPTMCIDNIISSWAFAVAEQILDETNVSSLAAAGSGRRESSSEQGFHPARSSSLSHRASTNTANIQPVDSAMAVLDRLGQRTLASTHTAHPPANVSDLESLAGNRADLCLLQRQIAERVAETQGWAVGLGKLRAEETVGQSEFKEVNLSDNSIAADDESAEEVAHEQQVEKKSLRGICQASLLSALSSIAEFKLLYEQLTNSALTQYLIATRTNALERLVADLALVKYEAGDYVAAASYLTRVAPLYTQRRWGMVETALLKVHAECLKKLNRKDDYVRMLLSLLARSAARQKSLLQLRLRKRPFPDRQDPWLDDEQIEVDGLLEELVAYSKELPYDMNVPMDSYFTDINVEPYIRHFDDMDGFSLRLRLRHLLTESLPVDKVLVRLKAGGDGPGREFWLETNEATTLQPGVNNVQVHAQVTIFSTALVDKIVIKANKISFELDTISKADKGNMLELPDQNSHNPGLLKPMPPILCYPRAESFDAELRLSRKINIDKMRTLEVECSSGWNEISRAEIHLRSASAGLRLRTADAAIIQGDAVLGDKMVPGTVQFSKMPPDTKVIIRIPYDLEATLKEINIGLDVSYFTPKGRFEYLSNPTIATELALDVTVHDLFKSALLFSKFRIRASRGIPLHILSIDLLGTEKFTVQAPPCKVTPMLVFPKQEGAIMYKIRQKSATDGGLTPTREAASIEKPLTLTVDYVCVDELAISGVEARFKEALSNPDLTGLSRLLVRTLRQAFGQLNYEYYADSALLKELRIPSYDSVGWKSLISGLPKSLANELEPVLKSWHERNQLIPLFSLIEGSTLESNLPQHRITIAVPLPRLHILHTVSLSVPSTVPPLFSTGVLISATVNITHTRRWDTPIVSSDTPLEFIFEIEAPGDAWLIGGQRRIKFASLEGERKSWPVMLMPLKAGRLLLPTVGVHMAGKTPEDFSCETDYESLGDTVMVLNDIGSTTIGIGEGGVATEAVLINSDRRNRA